MRTEFDHNAAQSKHREKCSICGREWYDSLVGVCPERGRKVCMYCCRRLCEESYRLPGQIGQRCRAWDRKKAEKRGRAAPHQSPAATASPRGSQTAAAGTGKETA